MPPITILITGAGIAGPVLAHWLSRSPHNYTCTILERSPVPRTTGQQIDVRGAALEIVQRMGLLDAVRAAAVQEQGIAFVDSTGKHVAEFAARGGGASFSSEMEILRGELARVVLDATSGHEGVEYVWEDWVVGMEEDGEGVVVRFAKGEAERRFDLVIVADGMNSRTRGLVFGEKEEGAAVYGLGQHMAYFTIPLEERDTRWATWYNATGGRLILLRPDVERRRTGAYFAVCGSDVPKGYLGLSVAEQKEMWEGLFKDAGGEAERVIRGMHTCNDFYMQEIAQVKMPRWSKGRVALLGDSAYCPSPISGLGASCAIIGAYVLAGELTKHGEDYKAGFVAYEETMRPIITKAQKLIPGAPALANPQTSWGISILYGILGAISWSGLANWFQGGMLSEIVDLPDYDM